MSAYTRKFTPTINGGRINYGALPTFAVLYEKDSELHLITIRYTRGDQSVLKTLNEMGVDINEALVEFIQ